MQTQTNGRGRGRDTKPHLSSLPTSSSPLFVQLQRTLVAPLNLSITAQLHSLPHFIFLPLSFAPLHLIPQWRVQPSPHLRKPYPYTNALLILPNAYPHPHERPPARAQQCPSTSSPSTNPPPRPAPRSSADTACSCTTPSRRTTLARRRRPRLRRRPSRLRAALRPIVRSPGATATKIGSGHSPRCRSPHRRRTSGAPCRPCPLLGAGVSVNRRAGPGRRGP